MYVPFWFCVVLFWSCVALFLFSVSRRLKNHDRKNDAAVIILHVTKTPSNTCASLVWSYSRQKPFPPHLGEQTDNGNDNCIYIAHFLDMSKCALQFTSGVIVKSPMAAAISPFMISPQPTHPWIWTHDCGQTGNVSSTSEKLYNLRLGQTRARDGERE